MFQRAAGGRDWLRGGRGLFDEREGGGWGGGMEGVIFGTRSEETIRGNRLAIKLVPMRVVRGTMRGELGSALGTDSVRGGEVSPGIK